jgi:hypothetical protein
VIQREAKKRIASGLLLLLALVITIASSAATDEQRDLSKYDSIGPFRIIYYSLTADVQRHEAAIRDFLWEHWRQRRKGTVSTTNQYVEGIATILWFVEPDKSGHWMIVEYVGSEKFSCAEFERVEPADRLRLNLPLRVIPESVERRPEDYLIHPICSEGKNRILW